MPNSPPPSLLSTKLLAMPSLMDKRSRLLDRISIGGFDECWLWRSAEAGNGHIQIRLDGRKQYVHRVVYKWLRGPIPGSRGLHHSCENPRCVNPKHLHPVNHTEHQIEHGYKGIEIRAARARAKTHCSNEHLYTEENVRLTKEGWRTCRECERIGQRRRALDD
jgi:hypothetical protein